MRKAIDIKYKKIGKLANNDKTLEIINNMSELDYEFCGLIRDEYYSFYHQLMFVKYEYVR